MIHELFPCLTETASVAIRVLDNRWYVAEISAMPHCRFNTDFHGNADDRKCVNAAIAQRDVKRCAFKC